MGKMIFGDLKTQSSNTPSDCPVLIPRIRNENTMSMRAWILKYEYFIDCIWNCIMNYIKNHGGVIHDPDDMLRRLELYLYRTSINKYYNYDLLK
jgi:hypothetical protein